MKNLTSQQKAFVSEYIKTLDGEVSAQRAGYKSKDLKSVANNLLSKDFVIYEIKNQLKKQISYLRVNKGYIIEKLLKIAEFSLEEEDITDKDGGFTGRKKLRDTSSGLKALENLCKYLGFTKDKDAEISPETKIITIENLDDSKI